MIRRQMLRKDAGATLFEVLIAVMILGLISLAVVGSLMATRSASDKSARAVKVLADLNAAAEKIKLADFVSCKDSATPYASPEPLKPSISVLIVPAGTTSLVPCTVGNEATSQLVVLTTVADGKTYTRSVAKVKP